MLFAKFKDKTGFVPNVARNFALTPEHFMRWFRYYDFLMRNEDQSHLTRKEREMIAVVVSSANECEYCLASHSAYLRELTGDPVLPDVLTANYRRAHLTPREHALLEFAHQITVDSAVMSSADVQMLRAIGLSDEAIFEAAQVAAMFNFTELLSWMPRFENRGGNESRSQSGDWLPKMRYTLSRHVPPVRQMQADNRREYSR